MKIGKTLIQQNVITECSTKAQVPNIKFIKIINLVFLSILSNLYFVILNFFKANIINNKILQIMKRNNSLYIGITRSCSADKCVIAKNGFSTRALIKLNINAVANTQTIVFKICILNIFELNKIKVAKFIKT